MYNKLLNLYQDNNLDYKIMSRFANKSEQEIIDGLKSEILKDTFDILKRKYNVNTDIVGLSKSQRLTALFKNILEYELFYNSEKYRIAKNELIELIELYQKNKNGLQEKITLSKLSLS